MIMMLQDLDRARSLDEVVRHHRSFLMALDRQAGKANAGNASQTWKHMVGAITKLLDQVIRFCGAQQALAWQVCCSMRDGDGALLLRLCLLFGLHVAGNQQQHFIDRSLQDSTAVAGRVLKESSETFQHLHRYLLRFLVSPIYMLFILPTLLT